MEKAFPLCSESILDQRLVATRLSRWKLQRTAQKLLPDERVAFCMRRLQASKVDVLYSPEHQSAHYGGLMRCGSVWVCPLCAVKISEQRRAELELAIARCIASGGVVYLATYTVAHKRYDTLAELLDAFLAARRRTKQGCVAQAIQRKFGILGTVSVREVTWSRQNGWHPHCHELVFFSHEIDADAYADVVRQRWQKCAEREGLSMNEHGFRFDRTYGAVGDYVAKFGREPQQNSWGAATELTKSHLKRGRGNEHLTPFAMLELISQGGHDDLKPIFREYAQWFKGKHQLVWSAGLRSRFLNCAEEETSFVEVQLPEDNMYLLGQLDYSQWSTVLRKEARGQLLEIARSGDWQDVVAFLAHLSADYRPATTLLGQMTNNVSQRNDQADQMSDQVKDLSQPIQQTWKMLPDQEKHVMETRHSDSSSFLDKWLGYEKCQAMGLIAGYKWGGWVT